MIEARIGLVTVSKILGHSSIQMTMRYAHPTPENMQRAVNKLGKIFEKSVQEDINHYFKIRTENLRTSLFLNN